MDISLWWLLPLVVGFLYWHFTNTFGYWKKKGVFYLEPTILFGNIKERLLFRKSFHEFQRDLYNKFQDHQYAGYFEGRRPSLFIRDPELIRHVMVKDFEHFVDRPTLKLRNKPWIQKMLINLKGQQWKSVRAILTPTFSSGKLKVMEEMVRLCGKQMEEFLTHNTPESSELEMKEFFGRFTMDVIASCAFGVKCDSLKDPDAEFVRIAAQFNDIPLLKRILTFIVIFLIPIVGRFIPLTFFNGKAIQFLADVVTDTKLHREKNKDARRGDFLQLMLDAAKKEQHDENEPVLDDDTIIAQALLFLLAGFETSSTLLTFASYELALNPHIQDQARQEIVKVLTAHGGECSYEALNQMSYLENVLLEALRKHPPVARVDRLCTSPYTLPGTDVTLDAGYGVTIPIMGLHYDSEYYTDPERFDPDRFLPENRQARSPYVFLPFGTGPRNCIGTRFALMSTKIAMIFLLKDFYLKPSPKTEVPYKFSRYSMLLQSQNGIWLNIKKIPQKTDQ